MQVLYIGTAVCELKPHHNYEGMLINLQKHTMECTPPTYLHTHTHVHMPSHCPYAEFCRAPHQVVMAVPEGVTWTEAAGIRERATKPYNIDYDPLSFLPCSGELSDCLPSTGVECKAQGWRDNPHSCCKLCH